MKRFLLFIALLPIALPAQYAIGVKSGLVVSDMRFLNADYASTSGFSVGLSLNIPLSDRVSFQPEVQYIQKGYTVTVPGFNGTQLTPNQALAEVEQGLNYLEFPLLVKVDLDDSDVRPFAQLGVAPALRLSQSEFVRSGANLGIAQDFRTFDLGIVVGGGIDWRYDALVLGVDLRYTLGVLDQTAGIRSQNRSLQLLGGISLLID